MKIVDLPYCGGKYGLILIVLKNSNNKLKIEAEQHT
jgi:hypothetical protein